MNKCISSTKDTAEDCAMIDMTPSYVISIVPPKMSSFAYWSSGLATESAIIRHEGLNPVEFMNENLPASGFMPPKRTQLLFLVLPMN